MKFSKKIHKLVSQNEQIVNKSQKHDTNLQNNSTLYFQVGLILTLLASYGLFEMNFESKSFEFISQPIDDTEVVYFVNVVPEVILEPVTEAEVEPMRKKLLAVNIIPVDNTIKLFQKILSQQLLLVHQK